MDSTGQALLKLLFDEGEEICVSPDQFAFHSIPLESALSGSLVLRSNTDGNKDVRCKTSDLTLVSLNPIKGRRCDENVVVFRSFLVEIDVGTLKEQLNTIKHLKMPFSAQVFSGGKSVHTAIVLDVPFSSEKAYRHHAQWILNIVTVADKNCKNPSRCIRIPGSYRESGKKQRLIGVHRRITQQELMDWLNRYPHLEPRIQAKKIVSQGQADFSRLSPWARAMLTKGIDFKNRGRNQTWYGLAYDMALAGFTEECAIEILGPRYTEEHDFKEKEWLRTIHSAFEHAIEGK